MGKMGGGRRWMVEAAREQHADPRARFEVGTEAREEVD
jgi:hypothetical protein